MAQVSATLNSSQSFWLYVKVRQQVSFPRAGPIIDNTDTIP